MIKNEELKNTTQFIRCKTRTIQLKDGLAYLLPSGGTHFYRRDQESYGLRYIISSTITTVGTYGGQEK